MKPYTVEVLDRAWRELAWENANWNLSLAHAIETGKIQAGRAGLRQLRDALVRELGMGVAISVIRIGGPFDKGPYIPLQ